MEPARKPELGPSPRYDYTHEPIRPAFDRIREENPASEERRSISVVKGSLWMVGITLALFFLPAVNGLIGGMVGGYLVGTAKKAIIAAVLPAMAAAVGLWMILTMLEAPILGLFTGLALGGAILLSEIGLFVGAAMGGAIAQSKVDDVNRA
jgi:hypothetical protein